MTYSPSSAAGGTPINRCGIEVTDRAMNEVALKLATGYLSRYSKRWVGYLHTVARNMVAEESE